MTLLRRLFYRKPPDGLLEICERVYVFDCCFTTEAWEEENYKFYIGGIVTQLQHHLADASFLVFNFREEESRSQLANVLSEYDMTIMEYPRHFEGCPVLRMEVIHHFLRSSESWLALGQNNVLLMHCERGGWPVLAFMLAALLIYRKQYNGEQRTLDMVYKQAPSELLHLLSPFNPIPSQLRYLQYISRRNVASEWPPLDRMLNLDCIILRFIPNFNGEGGCCPIFRIYGLDPLQSTDKTPKLLYSTPKKNKFVRAYKQVECQLVKIDISCHIEGDVVVECVSLNDDMEREEMMFRVAFNTAFIRSNILMLNCDEVDMLWDAKDKFPKDFRTEILFSEMDTAASDAVDGSSCFEEEGLPIEAFAKVQEFFNYVDWLTPRNDAALNVLQQISLSNIVDEKLDTSYQIAGAGTALQEMSPRKKKPTLLENDSKNSSHKVECVSSPKQSPNVGKSTDLLKPQELSPKKSQKEKKPAVLDNDRKNLSSANIESVCSPKQSVDSEESKRMSKLHDFQTKSLSLSKLMCQRVSQDAELASVSLSSTTYSDASIARHQGPSTAVGSKSHLQRDASSGSIEVPCPEAGSQVVPCPSSVVLHEQEKVDANSVSIAPPTPQLGPSLRPFSTVHMTSCIPSPPPFPPSRNSSLKSEQFSTREENIPYLHVKSQTSIVSSIDTPSTPISTSSIVVSITPSSATITPVTPSLVQPTLPPPPPPPLALPFQTPPPPPPPLPPPLPTLALRENLPVRVCPPPPPPPPPSGHVTTFVSSSPLPPKPPPLPFGDATSTTSTSLLPPPPPLPPAPTLSSKNSDPTSQNSSGAPPPPPAPLLKGTSGDASPGSISLSGNGKIPSAPCAKGRLLRTISSRNNQKKLKPLHWLKLSRAVQGSLWAEAQKSGEASKAPEIDILELENLFSAAVPNSDQGKRSAKSGLAGPKSEKVQLVDLRRAYNCEIMLSKVKVPLSELTSMVLSLDDSAFDVDQIENLVKFCPTKEEMELLKGYTGEKDKLGKCEQFFLELMQVPRIESKLRVFSFKIQFQSQVSDLRNSLNVVNAATQEIKSSVKLKRIMQTILSLGNALNQGTARGAAVGFKLDSLLKLTDTRARNNKMTLMHYLCKVLADKLPEVLDFSKDLSSLESASKIQLKYLAEEMQAVNKGLEKVIQELANAENDGPISEHFCKVLKEFLRSAEAEVRSLASLYSSVGRNVDALIIYFGEDPARCPFEQVVSTWLNFVGMFKKAHEDNCKQLELEMKKAAESDKTKIGASNKEAELSLSNPIESGNIK